MKKFILFFLVACLCMSFSACGLIGDLIGGDEPENEMQANNGLLGGLSGIGKNNDDDKYDELIEMLENEDYESAIMYIIALSEGNSIEIGTEDIIIQTLPIEAPEAISDDVRWTYENIVDDLDNYLETGYFSYYDNVEGTSYSDQEAFEHARAFLEQYSDYEAAKEYLSRITVVDDVLIGKSRVTYDHLDNSDETENWERFEYDANGRLVWADYAESDNRYGNWYDQFTYEYGADGNVAKTKIGWSDTDMLIVPTYENGVLTSEEVRCADGNVFNVYYTYDEMGRLSYWASERNGNFYTTTYLYNEMGLVAEELFLTSYYSSWNGEYVFEDSVLKTYTYDGDGHLVQMIETVSENYDDYNGYFWRTYTNVHDYAIDDLGRIDMEYVSYGDYTYGYDNSVEMQDTVTGEIDYVWGSYYFFE